MEKPSILIIDDDPGLRKTLADILRFRGFEPLVVGNGKEGLALLKENLIDLVLIDLGLPDMPGVEVLKRVKIDYPSMEAIIVTGNATLDSAIEATNQGAFSYLVKPYEIELLLLNIRRAIEKQLAEHDLKENELRLKMLLDTLPSGVIIVDPETHTIVDANATAVRIIGAQKEEIVGKICHRFICPVDEGKCPITDLGYAVENADRELLNAKGELISIVKTVVPLKFDGHDYLVENFIDITERKHLEEERVSLINALQEALANVKKLCGMLPICACCKKIRDDKGYWNQLEAYISDHTDVLFSHGYCPDCAVKAYEELEKLKAGR
jgi:PAS domain S-box-containing protein